MSIKAFVADMREYGIELTASEVHIAATKSLELQKTINMVELAEAALFFGQIGKMREAEGLDITKFELIIDLCNYAKEE